MKHNPSVSSSTSASPQGIDCLHKLIKISELASNSLLSELKSKKRFASETEKLNDAGGLSSLSKKEILKHVKTLSTELKKVDAKQLLSVDDDQFNQTYKTSDSIFDPRSEIYPIHDLITPRLQKRHINSDTSLTPASCVRYLHVCETKEYSIGIFVFPPHQKIPLHDHPHMCVLSRVLYGSISVKSYDILSTIYDDSPQHSQIDKSNETGRNKSPFSMSSVWSSITSSSFISSLFPQKYASSSVSLDDYEKTQPSQISSVPCINRVKARRLPAKTLYANDVATLFPKDGNMHEFEAMEYGCAILDVLIPPYDDDCERECTFYREQKYENKQGKKSENDMYWLVPIEQPDTFDCLSGNYGTLGNRNR